MGLLFLAFFAIVAGAVGGAYFAIPGLIVFVVVLALAVFVIHRNRCRLFANNPKAPAWLRAGCQDVLAEDRQQV